MHDDLPCMDDDDMRRGSPTVHKVYGSTVAILGGVAMIPLAVIVAGDATRQMGLPEHTAGAILRTLLDSRGSAGMIEWQQRDLAGAGLDLELAQVEGPRST